MDKVHFKWIIFLLILVIAGLVTVICFKTDKMGQPIVHYLSITATIMSIILSMFSIAFSYYSLTSSATQWSNMNAAISEMKEANNNINNNNQALLNNVITITRNIGALQAQIPNLAGAREREYQNERMRLSHPITQNAVRLIPSEQEPQPEDNE